MTPLTSSTIGASVLVGVDGSAEASEAAVLSRELARAAGGSLRLVTAAEQVIAEVVAIRSGIPTDRLHEALLDAAREQARRALAQDFTPDELDTALIARLGRPEHVMVEMAREVSADLLVVGGRRHGAPAAWFDRGTAHHLLRVCDAPVLVTGPGAHDIERVIAAVDLSFAAASAIGVGTRLASLLEVPFEVLHVVARARLQLSPDVYAHVDSEDVARREAEHAEGALRELLPEGVRRTIVRGDVVTSIRHAVGERPSLLVLGAQGRGWIDRLLLGSTTENLLSSLPCSLVIVPSTPEP